MWQAILSRAVPFVALPIAIVVGFVGYNFESIFSDKTTPYKSQTKWEEREERMLMELEGENRSEGDKRYTHGIPQTVLDRNKFRKTFSEGTAKPESD